ncbi:MAG: hypothetical protein V1810_00915 [Candidatus Beckwithbacteria bacterium]
MGPFLASSSLSSSTEQQANNLGKTTISVLFDNSFTRELSNDPASLYWIGSSVLAASIILGWEDSLKFSRVSFFSSSHFWEFSRNGMPEYNKREVKMGKRNINLGTASINLIKFSGQEPYRIKNSQGEQLVEIQPQDNLAFIHLNRQQRELSKISPLEKVQRMKQDLIGLFGLLDNDEFLNSLKLDQQATLREVRTAVIVGISHLVPLFRRKTGLPFWKLSILPEAVQKFHCLDSQAVSNRFGGTRKVKPEDVEMMVLTPETRRQLVASLA